MTDEQLEALSIELKEQLNADAVEDFNNEFEFRWRLGISIIGQECLRNTWYSYRWATVPQLLGHQVRIFADGNRIEPEIVAMLRRNMFVVHTTDPATNAQYRYGSVHGHYGGSADGIISKPDSLLGQYVLLEAKSHSTKSFSDVVNKGVKESKPQHYLQMCGYGKGLQLEYALYVARNKNDGDIYTRFVRLNWQLAADMELRAEGIITAREPLPKVSNKATDYRCKMCDHTEVCHRKAAPVITCRSCKFGYPVTDSEWFCQHYQLNIPREVVRNACPQYERLF